MSNTNYNPGLGNLPYGIRNLNPQGSNFPSDSAYSPALTDLVSQAIRHTIFDAAPQQFDALKLLMEKPMKEYGSVQFKHMEKTFGRSALVAAANTGAVAAVPGSFVTQTLTLAAASLTRISKDLIIIYEDGAHGVIANIVGNQVTVNSGTNRGLPAVTSGQTFSIQSTISADGMDYFSNYSRMDLITRYNYIQFFLRAQRWARVEKQEMINMGTTDYMMNDEKEKIRQIRLDFFNSFMNGIRGEYTFSNGYSSKSMGGVYPTMLAAGSGFANPTAAGLPAAFESLAFATNYKSDNSTRYICATHEMLNIFSQNYKQPGLRYTPDNKNANLDLSMIEIGGMKYVLVPCELFRENSCFEKSWARRILVLDPDSISPVKMKGIPQMEMFKTSSLNQEGGGREDFTDFVVKGQLSLEFNNPSGCFHMLVS